MKKQNIEELVIHTLKNIINKKDLSIDIHTKVKDLSLDQLDYTQLIIECEEHCDVLIDDVYFESLETINDIINYVLLETEKNTIN